MGQNVHAGNSMYILAADYKLETIDMRGEKKCAHAFVTIGNSIQWDKTFWEHSSSAMLLMCRQRSRYMIEWMMQVMSNFYGYAKEIMKFTRKKVVLSCHSRQARFRSINRFVRVIGESMHVEIIYIKLEMLLCILVPSGACDWPGETTTVERDRFPSDFETRKYQYPNHDIFTFWQNAVVIL